MILRVSGCDFPKRNQSPTLFSEFNSDSLIVIVS